MQSAKPFDPPNRINYKIEARQRHSASRLIGCNRRSLLCIPTKSPVLAKSGSQADAKAPAIDPDAMAALNKMGAYLRTIKSFQVRADVATDNVLDDGQAIQFSSKVDLVAADPTGSESRSTDDAGHRLFFFNGKNFTIFAQVVNFYATVPAPPTITELADNLNDKYGIELPLIDLFQWGMNEAEHQEDHGGR